jgi:hypothetical protein
MKKLVVMLAFLAAALVLSAPAMAWPADHIPWWQPAHTFTAAGHVTGIDAAGKLTIHVDLASRGAARYLDQELTVRVGTGTQLLKARGITFKQITFANVRLGQHARVTGTIDRSGPGSPSYNAKRVIVRRIVAADDLTWFAVRGPVTAVDAAGGSITVHATRVTRALWDKIESDVTLKVGSAAKIVTWVNRAPVALTLGDVTAGDIVMAQGPIDRGVPLMPVYNVNWMRVWHSATK